jgi:hypothetical protein
VGRPERKADDSNDADGRAREQPARERDVDRVDTDGRTDQSNGDAAGLLDVDPPRIRRQNRVIDVACQLGAVQAASSRK